MDVQMMAALRLSGAAVLPPPLVRAGRALLGWSRLDLAKAAGVSISSLVRMENGDTGVTPIASAKVRGALEAAGLRFTDVGRGGMGLRLGADTVEHEAVEHEAVEHEAAEHEVEGIEGGPPRPS